MPGGFRVLLHLLDQMSNDLGIRFRDELVAFGGEVTLQVEVVFHDAVVSHHNADGAVGSGGLGGGSWWGGRGGVGWRGRARAWPGAGCHGSSRGAIWAACAGSWWPSRRKDTPDETAGGRFKIYVSILYSVTALMR